MSYKIKDLTFRSKKSSLDKVNLIADDGQIVDVVIDNEQQMNFFKKVLLGKKKNRTGRFQIDDFDIINRGFTRKNVEFIKHDTWIQRVIPSKWVLILSLLFDQNFLRSASVKYIGKKYEYLSLVASKGEINDKKLRQNIDNLISEYINIKTKEEQKALYDAINDLKKYNQKKYLEIPEQWPIQIKLLSKAIENLKTELRTSSIMLMFQQTLWDNVYTLNELRDNCSCEYNAKHSSNKKLKKSWKKFTYQQTYYAVNKQLKIISAKIVELRTSIFHKNRKLNQFKAQWNFEFRKYLKALALLENDKPKRFTWTEQDKKQEYFIDWRKANHQTLIDIENKQKQEFIEPIRNTTKALSEEIIFLIHQYHERVLSDELEYVEKRKFLNMKKQKKKEIKSVFKQAVEKMTNSVNKYNIKFEWFIKSSVKYLSLNIVYLKILKAINLSKRNIIFSNITKHLSEKEFFQLFETIKSIQHNHLLMTFIFLNDSIEDVYNLDKKIYFVNNQLEVKPETQQELKKELKEIPIIDIFDILLKRSESNINKISYELIDKNQIKIQDRRWILNNCVLKNSGFVFFNPFKISLEFEDPNDLCLEVKIIKSKKYVDKFMHCAITKNKEKIYFYNKDKTFVENEKTMLYINKNAISNII
ncbi:hypothetical protein FOY66_00760 [Mycoplasma capricolum subsp. capripneumoniae]|uniref:hypothetical protein n=1 Tax=Mycoplasma capricolum TaxID=2095 RepID=UPI0004DA9F72|nr:hypothetical protein [Mycoplasma capricolum]KEY84329.1 hypothetical protein MCCP_6670 [Mycoplasma capricolum subsp. capripneumoniae 99108]QDL19384.1 hypothetical protein DQW15_00760 [Mycoplasma capricolum subsp. capripneumoniae]QDL20070.1 hypothetical protein DQW16_00760 [Mycoplasma capricolum subsp. capripneumoniae]QDL20756.1 hypothetical protein DQW17_00760 [Mycoplasma capricolum subsp. capripneumoniae]QIF40023.1 hypothetical protein MCCP002_00760 [Mycoplasma capricolum subsp. capripneumo